MFSVQRELQHGELRWRGESFICCGFVSRVLRAWGMIWNVAHLLARIFLLLRFRRRTRFFLHLALIFVDGSRLGREN
ncbi:hypothetical protein BJX96DRAFT_154564 [Aspergillus floccosus]